MGLRGYHPTQGLAGRDWYMQAICLSRALHAESILHGREFSMRSLFWTLYVCQSSGFIAFPWRGTWLG